ncbi:MAG TPA: hypothetical protein VL053_13595 [Arachidicoccus sp.]|nr:hypothetical protein [Arachidicoccus sp.]
MNKDKNTIELIECPRDAMQGWPHAIDTATKVSYLKSLLKVGFHTLDFGSFVSAKAIPQMADTKEVLAALNLEQSAAQTSTRLLAIVANLRGAQEAVLYPKITYLGFPFSISETFQLRNANSTLVKSFETVRQIQDLCLQHGKELVIYLSMGFGNPYGDPYSAGVLLDWVDKMASLGTNIISLADTVGLAEPAQIGSALQALIPQYPDISFGVHLHSTRENSQDKLKAALDNGCLRFDGALKGIGGCPMAQNALVGNMDTELMLQIFEEQGFKVHLNQSALAEAATLAGSVFI